MNIAVSVSKDYKDWEQFQSVLDSLREIYEMKFLIAPRPNSLITLYGKIDIVPCYVNSLEEHDKYSIAFLFSTRKDTLISDQNILNKHKKPYFIYSSSEDEFSWISNESSSETL